MQKAPRTGELSSKNWETSYNEDKRKEAFCSGKSCLWYVY